MSVYRPEFTTKTFWVNTVERIVRTGAQTALSLIVVDGLPVSHIDIDLEVGAWTTALAMLAALLTALAGKVVGDNDSPSFVLAAPPKMEDAASDGTI